MALALNKEYEQSSINMLIKIKKLPDCLLKGQLLNNLTMNKVLEAISNSSEKSLSLKLLITDLEESLIQLEGTSNNLSRTKRAWESTKKIYIWERIQK